MADPEERFRLEASLAQNELDQAKPLMYDPPPPKEDEEEEAFDEEEHKEASPTGVRVRVGACSSVCASVCLCVVASCVCVSCVSPPDM